MTSYYPVFVSLSVFPFHTLSLSFSLSVSSYLCRLSLSVIPIQSLSLSLLLSVFPFHSLTLSLSLFLSVPVYLSLLVFPFHYFLPLYPSVFPICACMSLSVGLSFSLPLSFSLYLSLAFSFYTMFFKCKKNKSARSNNLAKDILT